MGDIQFGDPKFEDRKKDHLRLSLDPSVQATGLSGLESIELIHEALPELDFADVKLETPCLGRPLATPFYVAGMTAGHADAFELNERLARACDRRGWAMGVGSQRRELDGESPLDQWARLRKAAPSLVLFGNIGLSQLIRTPLDGVRKLIDAISADALAVHLNAHQEAIQPEGTPQFRGGWQALERICRGLPIPVIAKETGCGISSSTAQRLVDAGVRVIDVSGRGGTHWGRIEGARAGEESRRSHQYLASQTFQEWGIGTAESVIACKNKVFEPVELWASGGVRSGLDSAKLIALGADRVGYAQPALTAALLGDEALDHWMAQQEFELKVALFGTGTATLNELKKKDGVWIRKNRL